MVKVSEEDIAWLYPATSEEDVAREWIELGASNQRACITEVISGMKVQTQVGTNA